MPWQLSCQPFFRFSSTTWSEWCRRRIIDDGLDDDHDVCVCVDFDELLWLDIQKIRTPHIMVLIESPVGTLVR